MTKGLSLTSSRSQYPKPPVVQWNISHSRPCRELEDCPEVAESLNQMLSKALGMRDPGSGGFGWVGGIGPGGRVNIIFSYFS